jgi:N utilization substance protein B
MLARRHLRIRVLQTIYTYFQQEGYDLKKAETDLINGTLRLYDLYLTLLQLILEIADEEKLYRTDVASKFIVTPKKFQTDLAKHPFVEWLSNDQDFLAHVHKQKISWQVDREAVVKLFYKLRHTSFYKDYISSTDEVNSQEWLLKFYKEEIQSSDLLNSLLEEKNIWWAESLELAHSMVSKTIKNFYTEKEKHILPLFKDEEDDMQFMKKLLKETIKDDKMLTELIANRTKNWDVERIALTDIIILKMALAEVLHFNHIPVKVSINEYIDISKEFSTPQSKVFINGVLDKIVEDLKAENRFAKTGRGLVEN